MKKKGRIIFGFVLVLFLVVVLMIFLSGTPWIIPIFLALYIAPAALFIVYGAIRYPDDRERQSACLFCGIGVGYILTGAFLGLIGFLLSHVTPGVNTSFNGSNINFTSSIGNSALTNGTIKNIDGSISYSENYFGNALGILGIAIAVISIGIIYCHEGVHSFESIKLHEEEINQSKEFYNYYFFKILRKI